MTIPDAVLHPRLRWLVLVIVAPLFFVGGPDWASGPLYKSAWNLGHIMFFAVLTLAVRPDRWLRGWQLWLVCTAVIFAAGWTIEGLQGSFGRNEDWHDMLRNLIGTWVALAWLPAKSKPRKWCEHAGRWLPRVISAGLLASELSAVAIVAGHQFQVAHQLPTVYDFDNPTAIRYWAGTVKTVPEHSRQGQHSLRIQLGTSYYSGVALSNLPWDWRGYDRLTIAFFNPGDELTLTLRINDQQHDRTGAHYHDRFNTHLQLKHGYNQFHLKLSDIASAPEKRKMAMGEIRRMGLFSTNLKTRRHVFLTELKLE